MKYTDTQDFIGRPESTPTVVKNIVLFAGCLTLICALLDPLFREFFGIPGPQDWFSLSWWGIQHLMLWQIFSFIFILHTGYMGVTFGYLLSVAISLYLLWVVGTYVCERLGSGSFLRLFFLSGYFSGLCTFLMMPILGEYEFVYGFSSATLALFLVLTMIYPDLEIQLFMIIPIKIKWLLVIILSAIIVVYLSSSQFLSLIFYLSAVLFAYLYATLAWGFRSPFALTHSVDDRLSKFGTSWQEKTLRYRSAGNLFVKKNNVNISQDEDAFLDEMLEKIAKRGENSLTWKERKRMEEISKRKMKKH